MVRGLSLSYTYYSARMLQQALAGYSCFQVAEKTSVLGQDASGDEPCELLHWG